MEQEPTITVEVDHTQHFVNTQWKGSFDIIAVARSCRLRVGKGGHQYRQLIDATNAEIARTFEDSQATSRVVTALANQAIKFGFAGATAVVVGHRIDFGMSRMIASHFEPAGEIQVFYRMAEAEKWLASKAERN